MEELLEQSFNFFDILLSFVAQNEGKATILCVFLSAGHRSRDVTESVGSFAGRSSGSPGEKTNKQTNKKMKQSNKQMKYFLAINYNNTYI